MRTDSCYIDTLTATVFMQTRQWKRSYRALCTFACTQVRDAVISSKWKQKKWKIIKLIVSWETRRHRKNQLYISAVTPQKTISELSTFTHYTASACLCVQGIMAKMSFSFVLCSHRIAHKMLNSENISRNKENLRRETKWQFFFQFLSSPIIHMNFSRMRTPLSYTAIASIAIRKDHQC